MSVAADHQYGGQSLGIDTTLVAVAIAKGRLEATFPKLKDNVPFEGSPFGFERARQLFEIDAYRIQAWACIFIDPFPLTKMGTDGCIDGWLNFLDHDDTPNWFVVQVIGGKL